MSLVAEGGEQTFAAVGHALRQSAEIGRSMRSQMHECCAWSNDRHEPKVTSLAAISKAVVCYCDAFDKVGCFLGSAFSFFAVSSQALA